MDFPPPRRFGGRAKWGAVSGNVALAALGAGLVCAALAAVPEGVPAVQALVAYTAAAVLATIALAAATAATRRLPTLRSAQLGGTPSVVARSWSGEWWYAVVLDCGLVALAGVLVALAFRAGGSWIVPGLLVGVAGAWFLVRVVLTLTGRRRNEALWLTPDEVVHDTAWGRERARRADVTRVRRATGTDHLVLEVDGPVRRTTCPRPWRKGHAGSGAGRVVVDCTMMGHDAADLAAWLGAELDLTGPPHSRSPRGSGAHRFGRDADGS